MSQYQSILVIVDPDQPPSPALERARHFAQRTGAVLRLEAFDHHAGIAAAGAASTDVMQMARKTFLDGRRALLERLAAPLRALGLKVETKANWGHPAHTRIVERVLEVAPDLVIKDIHVEPALRRLLFTPLDWQLARLCPAPLLLVNAHAHPLPQRVIASVDVTCTADGVQSLNDRIVHAALDLAIQCDASLHLLHSFDGLTTTSAADPFGDGMLVADAYESLRATREERFNEFAAKHGVDPQHKHFFDGPAASTISDFADTTAADVVVLGAVYRDGLERLMLGSTVERLLGRLHCDVLVVKPAEFIQVLAAHVKLPKELRPSCSDA